ncbi:MAG: NADH-quinone oxidoreductase subunit H [Deltaproteobacteria bacterium]|nr:NADH-quinone oxidoreductase subunit H [Deltaproteobacteria bacterium]
MDLTFLLMTLLKIVLICFVFAMILGAILTWGERKLSAVVQDRIGPNRASILGVTALGLMHPIADMLKAFTKEDFVPAGANRFLFAMAPMLAMVPPLVVFAVVPFGPGPDFVIAPLDTGVLFIFAIGGMGIYGATLGGWSSNNSFALLGSLRAAAQMISYEVSMGLNLVGIFMIFGTVSLSNIVLGQGQLLWGWLPMWGIVVQPVAFILFMTASMAENKRAPFDLPEGESEILGYNLEYSSMRFALFFLSEFVEIVVIAAMAATLFFGGWQIPWVDPQGTAGGWITVGQVAAFVGKVVFLCWVQLIIRWTLPRFRYDQVMALGWKYLLPLSLLNIVATAVVLAML